MGFFSKSEDQLSGVQLTRTATLVIVIGLNTKNAVCLIIYMLYPVLL